MRLHILFRREMRDTVFSRRFLIYLVLFFLPVVLFSWFYKVIYEDPSMLVRISAAYPEPIISLTPTFAMMFFVCAIAGMAVNLIAIIHASDFIAGEQARGTLLLLASKPLRRWEIIISKYLSFLVFFVPLIFLSLLSIHFLIPTIGIGQVPSEVFLGYFALLLVFGIVYTSITTMFSAMTKRTLQAILTALIFMIVWFTLDFIMVYLPESIADTLSPFSLSYHANTIASYMSGGSAILRMMHVAVERSFTSFLWSSIAIIILTVAPVVVSMIVLQKRDIHGR